MKTFLTTMCLVLGLGALSALLATEARAQVFTVLPVERDARVLGHERSAAFAAVRSARVLGPGAEFRPVGPLEDDLPPDQRDLALCLEVDCAARLAREAGLDLVIVVAVWPAEADSAGSVAVTLVDASGTLYEADCEIGAAGVAEAATTALVAATRQRNLGQGTELRVTSAPRGALVVVDGTEVGITPFVAAFPPGDHRVEVRLRGEATGQDVTLGDDPVSIDLVLGALSPGGPDTEGGIESSRRRTSPWNWIVGGALVVAGGLTLIAPLTTAARDGECVTEAAGGLCVERASFGGASIALLVVGASAVVGGALFMALRPLSVQVSNEGATVGFRGRF